MPRTVIDIQNKLLKKVQIATGLNRKVDIINYALKKLIRQIEIEKVFDLKGKIKWEGDLEEMRKGRNGSY